MRKSTDRRLTLFLGKTILASVIIEELRKDSQATVLFFYCRHLDPERTTFISLLRTLISQLLQKTPDLLPYVYDTAAHDGESRLVDEETAKRCLQLCLDACFRCYIVIDGLDECERDARREISRVLRDTIESQPSNDADRLRALFISQDDSAARRDLCDLPSLKITPDHNNTDIRNFVQSRVDVLGQTFYLSPLRRHEMTDTICEIADGTFASENRLENLLTLISFCQAYFCTPNSWSIPFRSKERITIWKKNFNEFALMLGQSV